ncbi:MAG: hypothetical protein EBY39_03300 [Flavobacteriia bacterium]|nr:hypothetical protein [Flavobacteriia bacterium]
MTKAELIEKLKDTVSIEKYNKLQKKMELKKNYIEELKSKVEGLEANLSKIKIDYKNALAETAQKSDAIINRAKTEYKKMEEDYKYLEDIVSAENELIELFRNKAKRENEFGDKLYEMYHKILFKENKE